MKLTLGQIACVKLALLFFPFLMLCVFTAGWRNTVAFLLLLAAFAAWVWVIEIIGRLLGEQG